MEIRWLRKALENLDQEAAFIAWEDPEAARPVVRRIVRMVSVLADNPAFGRPGRLPGTHEVVVPRTRYLIPYRVRPRLGRIEILRVFHMSRRLPSRW
jgi:toxin ParE1/3/4